MLVGKNRALQNRIEGHITSNSPLWTRCPVLVDGFIPPATLIEYVGSATCVIGKPGPGVVTEAAVLGVPFVTEITERTMAQEVRRVACRFSAPITSAPRGGVPPPSRPSW
tara:strand:+ start:170 stop:499 length:330 start_codon:yes stop_codon:yes gene_type:complete